jgi:AhpD family alkylhydroperoxidase
MQVHTEQPRVRMTIAHEVPEDYRAMAALDRTISFEPRLRELIKLRASIINGCAYCVDLHTRAARKLGESERRVAAVSAWRESPFFDVRERAALALTDAITLIHEEGVPDEVYKTASQCFEGGDLGQLIFAITAINAWNRIAVSTHMLPEADGDD